MTELPEWWEPLASRAMAARRSDFSRWPTPPVGGRRSAVLILLGEEPATGPDVLVLQRAASMRSHAGQPAFPGGGADPDDADAEATALREATEEVGLDPTTTTTVALLPRLWIPVSGYIVTPVLSWWHAPHSVHPASPQEVAGYSGCRFGSWQTPPIGSKPDTPVDTSDPPSRCAACSSGASPRAS